MRRRLQRRRADFNEVVRGQSGSGLRWCHIRAAARYSSAAALYGLPCPWRQLFVVDGLAAQYDLDVSQPMVCRVAQHNTHNDIRQSRSEAPSAAASTRREDIGRYAA